MFEILISMFVMYGLATYAIGCIGLSILLVTVLFNDCFGPAFLNTKMGKTIYVLFSPITLPLTFLYFLYLGMMWK